MTESNQKRRVLAPTDFSTLSTNAVRVADRIAIERNASLTLLHVHPIVQTTFLDMTYTEPPEKLSEAVTFLEDKLSFLAKSLSCTHIQQKVLIGSAVEQIVNESSEHGLLVMSTYGRTGLSKLLMGSVAERVVRLSLCSLLIVKE